MFTWCKLFHSICTSTSHHSSFICLRTLVSSRVQAVLPVSLSLSFPFTLLSDLSHKSHHAHLPDPLTSLFSLSPLPSLSLHLFCQPPLQVLAAIPEGCDPSDCDYYAAWTQGNNFDYVDFTLGANVRGWVALGLSTDRVMVSGQTKRGGV